MSDSSSDKPSYLGNLISHRPAEANFAAKVQSSCKWIFDFLRNTMIVGVLTYLAEHTQSLVLDSIAVAAFLLLWVYLYSYIEPWVFQPFHRLKNQRLAGYLDRAMTSLLTTIIVLVIALLLHTAIQAIAQGQAG